ncbi:MAG: 50S ribosomal protein L9 [Acidimicrobiales bacterium]
MIDVKLILRANVAGLGKRGDVVEVSPGYARNFLEPRGLAIKATAGNDAQAEAMRRSRSIKDAKDRESAEEIAKVLVSRTITVKARAGAGGKLFGSITNVEIAHAIAEQANVEVDRKAIHLDEHIKTVGSHQVQVRLHGDVEFPVTVDVSGS